MKSYLDILRRVLKEGKEKQPVRVGQDGQTTKVENGTIGLTNVFWEHDMKDGFPLLTTKKMAFKSMLVELEGFIKGICDKRWYEERNCKFWSYWNNPTIYEIGYDKKIYQENDNDLGPLGYTHQWRNFNEPYQPVPTIHTAFDKNISINTEASSKWIGKTINGKYGTYTVVDYNRENKKSIFTVKFHKTGFTTKVVGSNLKKDVKDPYFPSIRNVACLGTVKQEDLVLAKKLSTTWYNMVDRCYYKENKDYSNYGKIGVYVSNRWLVFSQFLEDVKFIPGWKEKLNNWNDYTIDKDYGKENCYSLENCRWITKKQQSRLRKNIYKFIAISPENDEYVYTSVKDCAKEHNLDSTSISRVINSKYEKHKGWTFKKVENLKNSNTDQIKRICSTIRENPFDRRIVVSGWNPIQLDMMALPPCHLLFNVSVYGDELNLHWHQRSCDLPLGVNTLCA